MIQVSKPWRKVTLLEVSYRNCTNPQMLSKRISTTRFPIDGNHSLVDILLVLQIKIEYLGFILKWINMVLLLSILFSNLILHFKHCVI